MRFAWVHSDGTIEFLPDESPKVQTAKVKIITQKRKNGLPKNHEKLSKDFARIMHEIFDVSKQALDLAGYDASSRVNSNRDASGSVSGELVVDVPHDYPTRAFIYEVVQNSFQMWPPDFWITVAFYLSDSIAYEKSYFPLRRVKGSLKAFSSVYWRKSSAAELQFIAARVRADRLEYGPETSSRRKLKIASVIVRLFYSPNRLERPSV
jgi:hypothetical protein